MKIKIWMPDRYGGTGLYRLEMPHRMMESEEFEVSFTTSSDVVDYDCDIFLTSKAYLGQTWGLLPGLKKKGVKTIVDYDDYWVLPQDHLLYHSYKKYNTTNFLRQALMEYDYVICTTELLRCAVHKYNPNNIVLENAIDYSLEQFIPKPQHFPYVRFGWVGGHCHLPDLMLIDGTPARLQGEFHIILFGHDRQQGSVYDRFAYILSGHGDLINRKKFNVVAQKPVHEYTRFYDYLDVCLAPLKQGTFESMKSELKIVEAACFKNAVIASNVMPYKPFLKHGENSLVCENKTDWYKNMTKLIKNPNLVVDLGEKLHDDLHDHFDLKRVNVAREQFYRYIVGRG